MLQTVFFFCINEICTKPTLLNKFMIFPLNVLKYIDHHKMQRMDIGECPKLHELALRADFENASKTKDYYYDVEVNSKFIYFIYYINCRTSE